MVILYSKTLDIKKGVDNHEPSTMSKGTTLFSCSSVEGERWLGLAGGCVQPESIHQEGGVWEALPAPHQPEVRTAASALTHLIQDLSLNEARGSGLTHTHTHTHSYTHSHAAPPSKRQCRSLSSDELMWGGGASGGGGGCGARSRSFASSQWRPQGSRVWSWVEKRRWHSGPPTHSHTHRLSHGRSHTLPLDLQPAAAASLLLPSASPPDSAIAGPELGTGARIGGGQGQGSLPRSRSQPCVLSEKKVAGVKRRRPDEHSSQEARPSLDLAKMTQKQHFHSLSCPGFSFFETCHSLGDASPTIIPSQSETTRTCPSDLGVGFGQSLNQRVGDGEEDSSDEQEEDTDSACSVGSRCDSPNRGEEEEEDEEDEEHGTFWKDSRRLEEKETACQLDEELDIEQIERN